jgi:hypothetical protein
VSKVARRVAAVRVAARPFLVHVSDFAWVTMPYTAMTGVLALLWLFWPAIPMWVVLTPWALGQAAYWIAMAVLTALCRACQRCDGE